MLKGTLAGIYFCLGPVKRKKPHRNLRGKVECKELITVTGDWNNEALAIKKRTKECRKSKNREQPLYLGLRRNPLFSTYPTSRAEIHILLRGQAAACWEVVVVLCWPYSLEICPRGYQGKVFMGKDGATKPPKGAGGKGGTLLPLMLLAARYCMQSSGRAVSSGEAGSWASHRLQRRLTWDVCWAEGHTWTLSSCALYWQNLALFHLAKEKSLKEPHLFSQSRQKRVNMEQKARKPVIGTIYLLKGTFACIHILKKKPE